MLKRLENINVEQLKELAETHEAVSYRELCKRLNIKEYTGNSKYAQLKDLEAICEFHMESKPTRYII